jgi:hypothetical protein
MKRISAAWVSLIATPALALVLVVSPLALTACSGGSSDESAATETTATEDAEATDDQAAATDQDSEDAADASSDEDAGENIFVDELGTLNVCAIDELGVMRDKYGLDFGSVLTNDGNGYLFNMDSKRWESDHGWFLIYDEKAEVLPGSVSYDVIQMNAETEAQPIIAVVAVSKEDYPTIQDAYKAVAEGPMGESDDLEFNSDGTWGKGIVSGDADEYLILAGDGGDVWQVDIIPDAAMQQALYMQLTGVASLTYVEAYVQTPEGTII